MHWSLNSAFDVIPIAIAVVMCSWEPLIDTHYSFPMPFNLVKIVIMKILLPAVQLSMDARGLWFFVLGYGLTQISSANHSLLFFLFISLFQCS